MITLEIGQLYGMNSIKEVLDAVKELQDSGMADANIQEVLDRSKDSTCKGWGVKEMTRGKYTRDFYFLPTILYHDGDGIYASLEFAWLKWYIGFCWLVKGGEDEE